MSRFAPAHLETPTVIVKKPEDNLITFDPNKHLTIGENDEKRSYQPGWTKSKTTFNSKNWGQMKLLVSELQFFNRYWIPEQVPNPICIYIGAASGVHIGVLSDLYPWFIFHLYDKNENKIANFDFDPLLEQPEYKDRIFIHRKYFDDTDVEQYANRNDVFLLSDIRNISYNAPENRKLSPAEKEARDIESELLVEQDMELQQSWTVRIRPVKALLKFRMPWIMPYTLQKSLTRNYLSGVLYKQSFAPITSTEIKLIPDNELTMQEWDFQAIESIMFHHNTLLRNEVQFKNPIDGSTRPLAGSLGFDLGWDSTSMAVICRDYLIKFKKDPNITNVEAMMSILNDGAMNGKKKMKDVLLKRGLQLFEDE